MSYPTKLISQTLFNKAQSELLDQFIINKIRRGWKSLKKTLTRIKENNPNKPIIFFDESRFNTKSRTGLGWFKKGSRTIVKVRLGFENFYVYSAVNPKDGNHFSLLLPNVNTSCMNIFLKEISEIIKEDFIMIMDGAGWHKL